MTWPDSTLAKKAGNNIITLSPAETSRWQRAAAGTRAVWYKEVGDKGIDGPKLAAEAEQLIGKLHQEVMSNRGRRGPCLMMGVRTR